MSQLIEPELPELTFSCGKCWGSGKLPSGTPCASCNGTGELLSRDGEKLLEFLGRHWKPKQIADGGV